MLPMSRVWCVVFFIMLFTLGADTELVMIETVIFDLSKIFKFRQQHRLVVSGVVCTSLYILGLPMATPGGYYIYKLIGAHIANFSAAVSMLLGITALCIYGKTSVANTVQFYVINKI